MKAYSLSRSATGGVERLSITIMPDLSKEGYQSFDNSINIHVDTKNEDTSWAFNYLRVSTYEHNITVCKAIVQILEKLGVNSLEGTNPLDLIETLEKLKYKKVYLHDAMHKYYTAKDWQYGDVYKLEIDGQWETSFIGLTEYEALKKARLYVLDQLKYSTLKKWLDWLENPIVTYYKAGEEYYEASIQPGNTMTLNIDIPA